MEGEDLKGCTLYKSKPLEYQTKRDYVHEGTLYSGLEGLQLSLRGLYIIVGLEGLQLSLRGFYIIVGNDCGV